MRTSNSAVDLRALHAFVAVCETKSMTEAARILGVSQSAVSQLIAALERDQGVSLFDRDFRPVRPNAAGRVLFEQAGDLLEHAQAVAQNVRAAAKAGVAGLRIGCVDSYAAAVGPHLVRSLSDRVQDLSLWSGLTPILSEQLANRELDLAICTEAALDPKRVALRPLFSECLVAAVPNRVIGEKKYRDIRDALSDLPLLRYTGRSVIGQQIERLITHLNIYAPRRYEFDDTDPLLSLVAAGVGCAVTSPLCLWQSRCHLADISVVPIAPTRLGHRHFFLMTRQGEWSDIAEAVAHESVKIVRDTLTPLLHAALPSLPAKIFDSYTTCFEAEGSR